MEEIIVRVNSFREQGELVADVYSGPDHICGRIILGEGAPSNIAEQLMWFLDNNFFKIVRESAKMYLDFGSKGRIAIGNLNSHYLPEDASRDELVENFLKKGYAW